MTFDAGYTLLGPRESFGAVYARVLGSLGVDLPAAELERGLRSCWAAIDGAHPPGTDRYRAHRGGEAEYWRRFVAMTLAATPGAPADEDLASRALEPLREAFRSPSSWVVYPDVVPTLEALRGLGVRLAVVSNWDSRLPALLADLGLADRFDAIAVSHLEGVEKPHPALFEAALARLGATREGGLHVGDVPELDGAGARAAGLACLLVDRLGRLDAGHGAVHDLGSLPARAAGEV